MWLSTLYITVPYTVPTPLRPILSDFRKQYIIICSAASNRIINTVLKQQMQGLALWPVGLPATYQYYASIVKCWFEPKLLLPLSIRYSSNLPGKTAEEDPNSWASATDPAPISETKMVFLCSRLLASFSSALRCKYMGSEPEDTRFSLSPSEWCSRRSFPFLAWEDRLKRHCL